MWNQSAARMARSTLSPTPILSKLLATLDLGQFAFSMIFGSNCCSTEGAELLGRNSLVKRFQCFGEQHCVSVRIGNQKRPFAKLGVFEVPEHRNSIFRKFVRHSGQIVHMEVDDKPTTPVEQRILLMARLLNQQYFRLTRGEIGQFMPITALLPSDS